MVDLKSAILFKDNSSVSSIISVEVVTFPPVSVVVDVVVVVVEENSDIFPSFYVFRVSLCNLCRNYGTVVSLQNNTPILDGYPIFQYVTAQAAHTLNAISNIEKPWMLGLIGCIFPLAFQKKIQKYSKYITY